MSKEGKEVSSAACATAGEENSEWRRGRGKKDAVLNEGVK